MWALTTHNATLTRFDAPEDIPDGYAIISHVWTSQEDSFQHVQSFNSQAATRSGYNSRDHLSDKMRMFCTLAESYGYRWAWSDTACINKESSAELSGDINSMFNYYAAAQICFVYLADVPGRSDPWQPGSYFRRSKWHRRGWTLQELLAPEMVVFLSVDWGVIGTKAELSGLLSEITSIPEQILTFEADITDVSIAQRMSWAAKRSTTREEDQAYCLLGIFGINMPMLYGEGGKAFYRLQEELMRTSNDTSLWAWGAGVSSVDLADDLRSMQHDIALDHKNIHASTSAYLFAESPMPFHLYERIQVDYKRVSEKAWWPTSDLGVFVKMRPSLTAAPTLTMTPHGINAHMPVIDLPHCSLALFISSHHEPIGLILTPCTSCHDPTRPVFHCGLPRLRRFALVHLVPADAATPPGTHVPKWRHVLLAAKPAARPAPAVPRALARTAADAQGSPFRVSGAALRGLRAREHVALVWHSPALDRAWTGSPPATLVFGARRPALAFFFAVDLGVCPQLPHAEPEPWAMMRFHDASAEREALRLPVHAQAHQCAADHVALWAGGTARFVGRVRGEDGVYEVTMELVCPPFWMDTAGHVMELQAIKYSARLL